jgi:hypothetical protein
MWSGSGSERTRSITGLNFKGGPSVAPGPLRGGGDSGIKGLRKNLKRGVVLGYYGPLIN